MLAPGFGELRSFDDAKLLSVSVNRLKKWGGPGVLCIGDAAHAMSPVSGVGVNLAVQDAIAAAAELGPALLRGETGDQANARVERRRKLPSILTQMMQGAFERGPIAAVLRARGEMKNSACDLAVAAQPLAASARRRTDRHGRASGARASMTSSGVGAEAADLTAAVAGLAMAAWVSPGGLGARACSSAGASRRSQLETNAFPGEL